MSDEGTAYSYRPSLMAAPMEFKLADDGIDWAAGHKSGHVRYRDVRRLRLSYRPVSMQQRRFMTELWAEGGLKLVILSCSCKSLFEQVRQDRSYTAFLTELHRRIAQAAPPAQFEQGRHPLLYWPGVVVFVSVAFALAALTVVALKSTAKGGVVFTVAFLALFLWRGGNYFRRNRPGFYRPDAPPAELLP